MRANLCGNSSFIDLISANWHTWVLLGGPLTTGWLICSLYMDHTECSPTQFHLVLLALSKMLYRTLVAAARALLS